MKTRKARFVFAIAVVLMAQTAGALDLDVPVGGDIQKAIDEVSSAGGGSVNLAAGVHRLDAPIRMRSNVKLCGKGAGATTLKTSKVIKSIVQASEGLRNVTIEDLGITGVPTHFVDLDKMINGLGDSNLMILAARQIGRASCRERV